MSEPNTSEPDTSEPNTSEPDTGEPRALRVLVGYSPDERGDDALALAALVRAADRAGRPAPLTVVNVHPPAWPAHGPASVDAEWVAYLRGQAEEALAGAAARLAELQVPRTELDLRVHAHKGSGRGLIEAARGTGADVVVVGSAPGGPTGRITLGSTADRLLHDSPVPVLLAPRGYAEDSPHHGRVHPHRPARRLERMTVAYWPPRGFEDLTAAADLAARLGLPVRLLTLVLRPPGLASRLGGVDGVLGRQAAQADEDLREAAGLLGARFGDGMPVERLAEVGSGVAGTLGAVDMLPGEILACLSGHHGPLLKVFLGERSGKIVRAAPCPVLVLPRGAGAPAAGEDVQFR
ncbi:universal stress protein [Actinomadura sp. WMMA1423]|uniref:universal stress protein n=1 Tax=Actinomadura sp. WMMA1423 TaxID=2591108 RepID=UPI0011470BFB|nr:universal stress protein [Actinomadura sp. WMMA1423]